MAWQGNTVGDGTVRQQAIVSSTLITRRNSIIDRSTIKHTMFIKSRRYLVAQVRNTTLWRCRNMSWSHRIAALHILPKGI